MNFLAAVTVLLAIATAQASIIGPIGLAGPVNPGAVVIGPSGSISAGPTSAGGITAGVAPGIITPGIVAPGIIGGGLIGHGILGARIIG